MLHVNMYVAMGQCMCVLDWDVTCVSCTGALYECVVHCSAASACSTRAQPECVCRTGARCCKCKCASALNVYVALEHYMHVFVLQQCCMCMLHCTAMKVCAKCRRVHAWLTSR
eukprot:scpid100208/ scgid32308/ 